jgi:hypothetical protein
MIFFLLAVLQDVGRNLEINTTNIRYTGEID